jgi:hypothetical protein
MKLVLHELADDNGQFESVAEWQPGSGDSIPDDFLKIYPENVWREENPQYFIDRIDGPTTMLTRVEQPAE